MNRARWKLVPLALAGVTVVVLAASAPAPAAPTAGPCLPPGVVLPPGAPKIPTCKKKAPASTIRVKVSGSVTVSFTVHTEYWGRCTPARGGGSRTVASADLDFGTPVWAPATVVFRTDAKTKKKVLSYIDAEPDIQATVSPKQDQRHEVPPGCGVVTDPTSCSQSKGKGGAVVHLSDVLDLGRVTVRPPAIFTTQCDAPFTGNSVFDRLSFKHELDDSDGAKMALAVGDRGAGQTQTIKWNNPQEPCGAYGVDLSPGLLGGTLEKCTIKADFQIEIQHLSRPAR